MTDETTPAEIGQDRLTQVQRAIAQGAAENAQRDRLTALAADLIAGKHKDYRLPEDISKAWGVSPYTGLQWKEFDALRLIIMDNCRKRLDAGFTPREAAVICDINRAMTVFGDHEKLCQQNATTPSYLRDDPHELPYDAMGAAAPSAPKTVVDILYRAACKSLLTDKHDRIHGVAGVGLGSVFDRANGTLPDPYRSRLHATNQTPADAYFHHQPNPVSVSELVALQEAYAKARDRHEEARDDLADAQAYETAMLQLKTAAYTKLQEALSRFKEWGLTDPHATDNVASQAAQAFQSIGENSVSWTMYPNDKPPFTIRPQVMTREEIDTSIKMERLVLWGSNNGMWGKDNHVREDLWREYETQCVNRLEVTAVAIKRPDGVITDDNGIVRGGIKNGQTFTVNLEVPHYIADAGTVQFAPNGDVTSWAPVPTEGRVTLDELLVEGFDELVPANAHASDCAVHNGPALEPGPCNCKDVIDVPAEEFIPKLDPSKRW